MGGASTSLVAVLAGPDQLVAILAFDFGEGGVLCGECARFAGRRVDAEAIALLRRILGGDLRGALTAPPDRRRNRGFDEVAVAADAKADVRANVYVVAHLDIGVPDRARTEAALRQLAAAARQSAGNVRFDIWQQTDRANHFNVISGWISESQFYAFAASHAARDFRQTVGPLLGSPYDERLYRRVD